MKQLFFCVVLLAILGIAGFLYRATLEGPLHGTNMGTMGTACTAEAKICPDGSSVGRTGPSCAFTACALPNVEKPEVGLGFVLPAGFREGEGAYMKDPTLISSYDKIQMNASSTVPDTLVVRRFAIPDGKDANAVMLSETMYESSGMQPKSMQEFKPVIINGKTYQMIVVERFEALVHVVYYLPREHDVLRFEALERTVTNWTDPALNVRTLSSVKALESLLGTVQSNEPSA